MQNLHKSFSAGTDCYTVPARKRWMLLLNFQFVFLYFSNNHLQLGIGPRLKQFQIKFLK